ncbi:glycosyltransferase family 2 protein [Occallatibacter savannae]|uniref:glycosyltransferase family 2 protein n=1 Tax=Occallatibacter savannae TaxID=1002691 RepID=UPI000D691515|nr:glycosyltransferase family 2 protein [Occallatibacter savannae]
MPAEISTSPGRADSPAYAAETHKIGVVTVLYQSAAVLPDFFASLEAQTHTNFVVYCVDNASSDGSADLCAQRGVHYVTIRNERNLGVAEGNNIGIRAAMQAGCDSILLLNNDVVFNPEMFVRLLQGLERHNADMVTPMVYFADPPDMVWCAGGAFNRWTGYKSIHSGGGVRDSGQFKSDRRIEYSPTCCVLVKTEVFRRVGLMDERYFVYWDDADWMWRAKKAGVSLWYVCEATLWHKVGSLTGGKQSDFSIHYGARNMAYFLYKNVNRIAAWIFRVAYGCYYFLNLLVPSRRDVAAKRLRGWREGLQLYRSSVREARKSVVSSW